MTPESSGRRHYRNIPIGGPSALDVDKGSSRARFVDAIRLSDNSKRKTKDVPIVDFADYGEDFFKQAADSEVVELIEIPQTFRRKTPHKLNRGVLGRILVARFMLMTEHPAIIVSQMSALCLSFDDAVSYACNLKGIAVESPVRRYIQTPKKRVL